MRLHRDVAREHLVEPQALVVEERQPQKRRDDDGGPDDEGLPFSERHSRMVPHLPASAEQE